MERGKKLMVFLVLVFLCIPIFVFAEAIILISGERIEGKIIEKTEDYIKMEYRGTSLTYSLEDIRSIDGKIIVPPSLKTDCVSGQEYSIIGKWEANKTGSEGFHNIFEFLENGDFLIYDLYDIDKLPARAKYKFIDKNHIEINITKEDGTTVTTSEEEIFFAENGKLHIKGDTTRAKYKFIDKSRIEIERRGKTGILNKHELEICLTKEGLLKLMYLSPDGFHDSNLYYRRINEKLNLE